MLYRMSSGRYQMINSPKQWRLLYASVALTWKKGTAFFGTKSLTGNKNWREKGPS